MREVRLTDTSKGSPEKTECSMTEIERKGQTKEVSNEQEEDRASFETRLTGRDAFCDVDEAGFTSL